jgi:hypothetical protein
MLQLPARRGPPGERHLPHRASTAYPQPAPGQTQGPGPLVVVTDQLQRSLGVREGAHIQKQNSLVVIDQRPG